MPECVPAFACCFLFYILCLMDYQAMYPWAPENLLEETSIYTSHEQIMIYMKANAPRSVFLVGKRIKPLS